MITVIIPVYNIAKRGFHRLDLGLYSLSKQGCKVIVCDGSDSTEKASIKKICKQFENVRYVHFPMEKFNKPLLHNSGVILSTTDWVLCADADFCYSPGFIKSLENYCTDPENFTIKLIHTSNDTKPTRRNVDQWFWTGKKPFPFGVMANALQLFSKTWFTHCGGYDESMEGWGAMDNDMVNRAKLANMHIHYISHDEGPEVMHIFHKQEKDWNGPDMKANWDKRDKRKNIKVND